MQKCLLGILFLILCIQPVAAKTTSIYVLNDGTHPVKIKKTVDENTVIYMRDPNLGGPQVVAKPLAKVHVEPKKTASRKSQMAFKPVRIAGSIRQPRVEFGRVRLSQRIRDEELPSDFVQRSLDSMP